jgi:hypothetical protein
VRARWLLLLMGRVGWRVVGRPFRGRWRCRGRRLWVARVVVGVVIATVVVVVIAARAAAVIARCLARAAVLEQTL